MRAQRLIGQQPIEIHGLVFAIVVHAHSIALALAQAVQEGCVVPAIITE